MCRGTLLFNLGVHFLLGGVVGLNFGVHFLFRGCLFGRTHFIWEYTFHLRGTHFIWEYTFHLGVHISFEGTHLGVDISFEGTYFIWEYTFHLGVHISFEGYTFHLRGTCPVIDQGKSLESKNQSTGYSVCACTNNLLPHGLPREQVTGMAQQMSSVQATSGYLQRALSSLRVPGN